MHSEGKFISNLMVYLARRGRGGEARKKVCGNQAEGGEERRGWCERSCENSTGAGARVRGALHEVRRETRGEVRGERNGEAEHQ